MEASVTAFLIVLALVALLVIVTLIKSVRVVQQQTVGIVSGSVSTRSHCSRD